MNAIRPTTGWALLLAALILIPGAFLAQPLTTGAAAQAAAPEPVPEPPPLPPPASFVSYLDVRCYDILDQPPLGVPLHLDHLNPLFVEMGLPPEDVVLQEPQQLCVPVVKNDNYPPPDALPFLQYVDWKCYGIEGPPLDLPLNLNHLNPVIVEMFGEEDFVWVREPQQLCVPVVKDEAFPPPEVRRLVEFLDVKCYRVESERVIGGEVIQLTHLNPLFQGLPPEDTAFVGPAPTQLCVPVAKNGWYPPDDVLQIIQYSDVLCYGLEGPPLDRPLALHHLNPVLLDMGLPSEHVYVGETEELCVPVAKEGRFPPG
jgi:hypothetical protein